MQIGSALLLGGMVIYLLPKLPRILKATPKASGSQWMTALIPIALVGGFIYLLMKLV